ncbi:hypothetical protein [Halococcus saccharolyticus]|uniref:Nucleoside 2-deoxyribosyltransferase n=1 Tax=Halococcus saccharolyticus DSM 5350 TaxID=1227455 RepID=M0MQK7_9EURY|nr:hypothetical protein [Halococcus saccharolyticus]EMA47623.1 hypothetical protein C449_01132 [Halococcus saccharolyticus DSM 5350]
MTTIYLAGPIENAVEGDGGSGWRIEAETQHPRADFKNPLDKYDASVDDVIVTESEDGIPLPEFARGCYITDADLVAGDKELIDESDALLAREELVVSRGTPMEVHRAYTDGMPVAIWFEGERDDLSPWMRDHADFISESLDACVAFLRGATADRHTTSSFSEASQ